MHKPLIYNLTLKISKQLSEDWFNDMESRVIPSCVEKDLVLSSQITRILVDDEEDHTFAVQFVFPSLHIFHESGKDLFKKMVLLLDEKFRGKYVYFTTMMEVMHYSSNTENRV